MKEVNNVCCFFACVFLKLRPEIRREKARVTPSIGSVQSWTRWRARATDRSSCAARSVGQRPLETVARSAARVRLLSSLLALYCALNGLGALLDATADPNLVDDDAAGRSDVALSTTELALNVAGVWVGAAGLRASQRLDPTSVDAYDRSLRLLAVATLSYEAYHSLVVLPNTLPERFQRARDAADAEAAETLEPPDANATAVERRDDDDDDDPTAGDGGAAEASLSRESLILSGFVTVMLWASIWLVCVNNAARLRLAVREHGVAALTVADLHAAANRDAFFP